MNLSEAVRITRAACQARSQHGALRFLRTVEERLKPAGVKEKHWPQLSQADSLQLHLAQCRTESPLRPQRMPLLSSSALHELWAQIDYAGPVPEVNPELGCCWLWKGRRHPDGYGVVYVPKYNSAGHRVKYGGKRLPVYIVMFILDRHRYPRPVCRHRCGNNQCVNSRHLTTGTVRDNARDRQAHGRTQGIKRSKKVGSQWGSSQGLVDIVEIPVQP